MAAIGAVPCSAGGGPGGAATVVLVRSRAPGGAHHLRRTGLEPICTETALRSAPSEGAARFGHPPGEFAVERAESELLLLAHVT
jgi:hypothetical protein